MGAQQPMVVLGEESERLRDKDAQSHNISAAKAVAEAVRTTLGPKGMDKMIVAGSDITVTNDGVTVLEEMDIENPTAKMIVEVAKAQEEEAGDGTTTAVALAGELLKNSEELLDKDVHPTTVAQGYRLASIRAKEELEKISVDADRERLKQVALTAMTGRNADIDREHLAELALTSVEATNAETDNIKSIVKTGAAGGSELVEGLVLEEEPDNTGMPHDIDGDILLLDEGLDIEETELDADVSISGVGGVKQAIEQEEGRLQERAKQVTELADIVFTGDDIADVVKHHLARNNVLAIEDIDSDDLEFLSRVTDARIANNIETASKEDIGQGSVKYNSSEELLYIEGNGIGVTLILRGGTEQVGEEIKRGIEDAIEAVSGAYKEGKVIPGGGATEIELSLKLRNYAESLEGREQLAAEVFSDSLEMVPRTLAENSGLDTVDTIVGLRSKHESGEQNAGLDVDKDEGIDSLEQGIVEPIGVKRQAISSAEEVASMILRIDDVVSAEGFGED